MLKILLSGDCVQLLLRSEPILEGGSKRLVDVKSGLSH